MKCTACKGTGYQSAAQNMPADTPSILMPVGVWPCSICNGTGKGIEFNISEEDLKKFREALNKPSLKPNPPTENTEE